MQLDEVAPPERRAGAVHADQAAKDLFERRLADAQSLSSACEGLSRDRPEMSIRSGLSGSQDAAGRAAATAFAVFAVLRPEALGSAALAAATLLFSTLIALRLAAVMARPSKASRKPAAVRIPDEKLPPITYLVPLYREANVVASLVRSIEALDYPPDRLQVILLAEGDDRETLNALMWLRLPAWFEIVPVPPSTPRTKPKALNYGLAFSRGDIIAVLDAEDRPSPGQPREAVAAFRAARPDLAVVQAPLTIHNARESWIARQFSIEYAIHFLIWLPFLTRLGWPLALGGTSNYFRRSRLFQAGGWDAWNVTEDADIGLRLARFGGKAAMIDAPTFEEAPVRLDHWMSQRTRWMKGHLQTWLVVTRDPVQAVLDMGLWRYLGVVVTLGGSLAASAMHGPIVVWMLLGLFTPLVTIESWHSVMLGAGYGSAIVAGLVAKAPGLNLWSALRMVVYWPLMSVAMIAALWDLKVRPHFWAKTPHGVSRSAH